MRLPNSKILVKSPLTSSDIDAKRSLSNDITSGVIIVPPAGQRNSAGSTSSHSPPRRSSTRSSIWNRHSAMSGRLSTAAGQMSFRRLSNAQKKPTLGNSGRSHNIFTGTFRVSHLADWK
jgi:hypothetical protein